MKASVVIPVYNEERYLAKCIESLLKQTFKDFEIIFVDDGSIDDSRDIIKKYAKGNPRIRLLKQNHNGPGKARNLGAKYAKGDILVFVDADMSFDKNYIKNLIKPIIDKKVIGTSHKYEYVANKDNIWARSWSINRIPKNNIKWTGIFRAVRKDKFLESGEFDAKKGYFDDDLSKIGKALMVDAVCYHNNPETLKEAFKHSVWVGGSFFKNKKELKGYFKKYSFLFFAALVFLILLTAITIHYAIPLTYFLLFLLIFVILLLEIFATKRLINEGYLSYMYSIPILMIVRFSGYFWGLVKWKINPAMKVSL